MTKNSSYPLLPVRSYLAHVQLSRSALLKLRSNINQINMTKEQAAAAVAVKVKCI